VFEKPTDSDRFVLSSKLAYLHRELQNKVLNFILRYYFDVFKWNGIGCNNAW